MVCIYEYVSVDDELRAVLVCNVDVAYAGIVLDSVKGFNDIELVAVELDDDFCVVAVDEDVGRLASEARTVAVPNLGIALSMR